VNEDLSPAEEAAYAALESGDPERALLQVVACLQDSPGSAHALRVRGLALIDLERLEDAHKALVQACRQRQGVWEGLFDLVELEIDMGEPEAALRRARRAMALAPSRDEKAELLHLQGDAYLELNQAAEALAQHEAARRLGLEYDDAEARGEALFELGRYAKALAAFRSSLRRQGMLSPAAHFLAAVALERSGDPAGAARHFQEAVVGDPKGHFYPQQIPELEFEELLRAELDALPPELGRVLEQVSVVVHPWPEAEELAAGDPPFGPLLLGLFMGASLLERSHDNPWSQLPAQVVIYKRNLELVCRDAEELREELRVTLWHELGHYLGLDEEDLEARGLN